MATVEAHLVYDPGSHPALIGRTSSREALQLLRAILLEEAEEKALAMCAIDDPILRANEEADLQRLRTVLDALVPGGAVP